jgi:hypothetical protein
MAFKSVVWAQGEGIDSAKLKQMADNDEEIRQLYLSNSQGTLGRAVENSGGFLLTNTTIATNGTAGTWVHVLSLNNVVIPPGRWTKVMFMSPFTSTDGNNEMPPMRVTQDGTEILYARSQKHATSEGTTVSGTRMLAPRGRTSSFELELGNILVGSYISNVKSKPNAPITLSIEDMGAL